jgi:hypothetical protein
VCKLGGIRSFCQFKVNEPFFNVGIVLSTGRDQYLFQFFYRNALRGKNRPGGSRQT